MNAIGLQAGELQVSERQFKGAMRHLAASPCVITTATAAGRAGLTATAVCSLSSEPPSLIVCVNRGAEAYAAIEASRALCVNILDKDQSEIAQRFSGAFGHKGESRFGDLQWRTLATGAPVLQDALSALDCEVETFLDYGTHRAFICSVRAVQFRSSGAPLVYAQQRFGFVQA